MRRVMMLMFLAYASLIILAVLADRRATKRVIQADLTEREKHCEMVWGDSKHFKTCMNGERVIPSSGR